MRIENNICDHCGEKLVKVKGTKTDYSCRACGNYVELEIPPHITFDPNETKINFRIQDFIIIYHDTEMVIFAPDNLPLFSYYLIIRLYRPHALVCDSLLINCL